VGWFKILLIWLRWVKVKMNLKGSLVVSKENGIAKSQAFSREVFTRKVIGTFSVMILPTSEREPSGLLSWVGVSCRLISSSHDKAFVWEIRVSKSMRGR
jgi:hypothetical protein